MYAGAPGRHTLRMTTPIPACPDCGSPLGPGPQQLACARCRLPLTGPDAAALWQVETALRALDQHRVVLVHQRDGLLAGLRARRDGAAGAAPVWSVMPAGPAPVGAGRAPEVSGRSAQTVLLVLGGLLVSLAALVFTVVSWGYLGIGGRTAVLLALTACALALPGPLRGRGLTATAEASAAVGLGLVLLDAFAARAADFGGLATSIGDHGYWAAVTALVAAGSLGYGAALRLRFPLATGFLLTRLPALLALRAAGVEQVQAYAAVVVGGVALDCVLLHAARRADGAGRLAGLFGADTGVGGAPARQPASGVVLWPLGVAVAMVWALIGAGLAVAGSVAAGTAAAAGWAFGPLGMLAALGWVLATRYEGLSDAAQRVAAAGSGTALVLAAGGVLRHAAAEEWTALAYGLPAAVLFALTALRLRRGADGPTQQGAFHAAAALLALTTCAALPEVLRAVLEPVAHAPAAWTGPRPDSGWPWLLPAAAPTGLALAVAALAAVTVLRVTPVPAAVLETATATTGALLLAVLPITLGLPYGVAVAVPLLLASLAAAALALGTWRPGAAAVAVLGAALGLLWASADRAATIGALAVCAVLAALLAWRVPLLGPVAGLSVVALGADAVAVGTTAGLTWPSTMLALLGVAVASAPAAALTARRSAPGTGPAIDASAAVEFSGYLLGAVALLLTAAQPGPLAFALAVAGVAALGVALRPGRRRPAGIAATALLLASSWVRLALWQVHTPEAYTLPLAAAALVVGHLRHRRDPQAASWSTYGTGLSLALVPSVLALWADGHWLRPLLLGTAALAATVAGVRLRLGAPVLLGGGALLLTAGHELAPTVVQVLGLLPRWLPLAAAGLLLLALGAGYEQRLRDARRLRASLRRLR
ncbi:hypothetical protein GCM10010441_04500 [Kitasatospora paracochleata]